ncbi:MAG: hypothetical protein M1541_13995 [Acidobacteria bacterium]|nr:hypothetical protein [Acidobacteriota bacterium]
MRGVSDGAVRKWINAGKLPVHADGIDPAEADVAVASNCTGSQVSKIAEAARACLPAAAVPAPIAAPAPTAELPLCEPSREEHPADSLLDQQPTRADVEIELAQLKAERQKLALERERGEVIPVAEAEQAIAENIEAAKNELLLMPHRLAERLAASKDPAEVRSILEYEVRQALERLEHKLAA